jgi:TetR/AcrR family transcriptional repressor of mexJK operon
MDAPAQTIVKGRKFDQVLDGARAVFLEHGFANANMDEVARRAQVSKATVYSYFPDKNRLFFEVIKNECLKQADRAVQVIDQNAPVEHVLRQAGHQMISFMSSEFSQRIFRICVAEADRFPDLGRAYYETGPSMGREKFTEYFKKVCDRGELNIDDFEIAADQFMELCKAHWWHKVLFGLISAPGDAETNRVIDGAVRTFMARYAK